MFASITEMAKIQHLILYTKHFQENEEVSDQIADLNQALGALAAEKEAHRMEAAEHRVAVTEVNVPS